jgi:hypothetical protein
MSSNIDIFGPMYVFANYPYFKLVHFVENVIDVSAMEFIHMNVYSRLVINLYLTPNLVLVHFQLVSN